MALKARKPLVEDEEFVDDDDTEFEEERPARPRRQAAASQTEDDAEEDEDESSVLLEGGWKAHKRHKAETSSYPNRLTLSEDPVLVMFLEDEPLVSYRQHWVEREGKKSFVCIKSAKTDCPLCNTGDKPKIQNVFNVVRVDGGAPTNLILTAGVRLSDYLENKCQRTPLSRGYFSLSRIGKGGRTNFDVDRVKERDLEEDWEVEPLDDETIAAFKRDKWEAKDTVVVTSKKDLADIAREMVGDYDEDF